MSADNVSREDGRHRSGHGGFMPVDATASGRVDAAVARALLDRRRYAYAVTDRNLRIRQMGGATILWPDSVQDASAYEAYRYGTTLWEVAPELQSHAAELKAILMGAMPRFEIPTVHRGARADRGPYVTLVNVPYRNEYGQIVGVLHCVEEVTDAALLQQRMIQHRNELSLLREQLAQQNAQLSTANAELEQLDQMKSTFVSTAAHELRTPIFAIVGYTELLLDAGTGPLNSEQRQYLTIVERNAHRLSALGSNLLDITRLETGHVKLSLRATNLLTLAESAAEQIQPAIDAKNQQLILDASPGLARSLCDSTRILQVVTNLLNNASKYTPTGGTIVLRLANDTTAEMVQISVKDTGIGVPPEDQDRLFERFFRASNVQQLDTSGVGLGLYIVKMLVELQGGTIWFDSMVGQGTTFYVNLPMAA